MLQERDVFKEIIKLLGLTLLVYFGLYSALQYGLSELYFSPFVSIGTNRLMWVLRLAYALLGLWFLLSPASIATFAYPREQSADWNHNNILNMGVKLAGIWLILSHLGTFLQHLQHYLGQVPLVGRYQVLTHSIWLPVAIYLVIIIIGMIMIRYQPRARGVEEQY